MQISFDFNIERAPSIELKIQKHKIESLFKMYPAKFNQAKIILRIWLYNVSKIGWTKEEPGEEPLNSLKLWISTLEFADISFAN